MIKISRESRNIYLNFLQMCFNSQNSSVAVAYHPINSDDCCCDDRVIKARIEGRVEHVKSSWPALHSKESAIAANGKCPSQF